MNNISYFEIQANNPEKAVEFYHNIFGWNFEKNEYIPIEYYRISWAWIEWWLLKRPVNTPPQECWTNAFTCSIQVENFDEIANKILENDWIVAMEKFAIHWICWQWYFLDTDNNVFWIVEINSNAK